MAPRNPQPAKPGFQTKPGFQIFDKAGKTGDRIAANLESGVVIETDGPGKYFLYVGGRQHPIASKKTLEEITGNVPVEAETDTVD